MSDVPGVPSGGFLPAEPLNLAATVAYNAGAIVSRTLLKKPAGTVTAFAFDAGQELSEHTAPFDAVIQVLDGRARVRVGERTADVEAGSAVLLPAGVPHAVKAAERFKMLLSMFRAG